MLSVDRHVFIVDACTEPARTEPARTYVLASMHAFSSHTGLRAFTHFSVCDFAICCTICSWLEQLQAHLHRFPHTPHAHMRPTASRTLLAAFVVVSAPANCAGCACAATPRICQLTSSV